jgi:hypothetical protein
MEDFHVLEGIRLTLEAAILAALLVIRNDLRHVWRNIDGLWQHVEQERGAKRHELVSR